MKNELILHIGTPKTGTSALQKFLFDNTKQLLTYGYSYPNLLDMMKNAGYTYENQEGNEKNGFIFRYFVKIPGRSIKADSADWNKLWELILEQLQQYTVILSAEEIWWWDTKSFITEVKKKYDNVKVIVYLRRQDRYLESSWNQRVKYERFTTDTFYDDLKRRKNDPVIFRYLNKLEQIETICGRDQL